jgi:hypothetical protein
MADELALIFVYGDLVRKIARSHGLPVVAVPWRPIVHTICNALVARAVLMLPVSWVPGVATVVSSTSAAVLAELLGRYIDAACASPKDAAPLGLKELTSLLRKSIKTPREPKRR